jgi:hypothetical protein
MLITAAKKTQTRRVEIEPWAAVLSNLRSSPVRKFASLRVIRVKPFPPLLSPFPPVKIPAFALFCVSSFPSVKTFFIRVPPCSSVVKIRPFLAFVPFCHLRFEPNWCTAGGAKLHWQEIKPDVNIR